MIKRTFDIICSTIALMIILPLLLWASWCIKRTDDGPVFYRGVRVGLDGRLFRIFKFRTMVVNAEKIGSASTAEDDQRITRIGKFLRKYKLDELPQLINVIKGDMSLVGPRPEVKYYTDQFTVEQRAILSVRPGITDWASIWNSDEGAVLAGKENPGKAYEELIRPTKLRLQLKYVEERNLFVDIKIIWMTILAIIKPESQAVREMRSRKI